jgi:hypothetical protein
MDPTGGGFVGEVADPQPLQVNQDGQMTILDGVLS